MAKDCEQEGTELRAAIGQSRDPDGSKSTLRGSRVPRALKLRAIDYATLRVKAGETMLNIAAELGLSPQTLETWLVSRPVFLSSQTLRMRPVVVVPRPGEPDLPPLEGPAVVLPNGLRVMGLSIDQITSLVRELK